MKTTDYFLSLSKATIADIFQRPNFCEHSDTFQTKKFREQQTLQGLAKVVKSSVEPVDDLFVWL